MIVYITYYRTPFWGGQTVFWHWLPGFTCKILRLSVSIYFEIVSWSENVLGLQNYNSLHLYTRASPSSSQQGAVTIPSHWASAYSQTRCCKATQKPQPCQDQWSRWAPTQASKNSRSWYCSCPFFPFPTKLQLWCCSYPVETGAGCSHPQVWFDPSNYRPISLTCICCKVM